MKFEILKIFWFGKIMNLKINIYYFPKVIIFATLFAILLHMLHIFNLSNKKNKIIIINPIINFRNINIKEKKRRNIQKCCRKCVFNVKCIALWRNVRKMVRKIVPCFVVFRQLFFKIDFRMCRFAPTRVTLHLILHISHQRPVYILGYFQFV